MDTFEIFCNPTDVFYNRAMHILRGFVLELGYAREKTQNFVVGWFLKEGIIKPTFQYMRMIISSMWTMLWLKKINLKNIYQSIN